jgi:hypothetical protein
MRDLCILLVGLLFFGCGEVTVTEQLGIISPDQKNRIEFLLGNKGEPFYKVYRENEILIDESSLGFVLKENKALKDGFMIESIQGNQHESDWETLWGEQKMITAAYEELEVKLMEKDGDGRIVIIRFRAFNDGVAFRYEFPEQENLSDFEVMDELTEFNFTEDLLAWWIPADYDSYEYLFTQSKVSEIDANTYAKVELERRSVLETDAVTTPLTLKTSNETYLSIHEANLRNYPGMTLKKKDSINLTASLVPGRNGIKASLTAQIGFI